MKLRLSSGRRAIPKRHDRIPLQPSCANPRQGSALPSLRHLATSTSSGSTATSGLPRTRSSRRSTPGLAASSSTAGPCRYDVSKPSWDEPFASHKTSDCCVARKVFLNDLKFDVNVQERYSSSRTTLRRAVSGRPITLKQWRQPAPSAF